MIKVAQKIGQSEEITFADGRRNREAKPVLETLRPRPSRSAFCRIRGGGGVQLIQRAKSIFVRRTDGRTQAVRSSPGDSD